MKRQLKIYFFISLYLFAPVLGLGQLPEIHKPTLSFNNIVEGLNNERVTAVGQDKLGFIWIGTYNGLHRYDGINFKLYTNSKDSSSLPNSRIEKVFNDRNGNLWR